MFVAAAAGTCGLGPLRGWRVAAAGTTETALFGLFFLLRSGDLGLGRCFGSALRLFLGKARLLDGFVFGLAILFGAAALVFRLLDLGALLAAARFLEARKAGFLRLAQKLRLKLLAAQHFILGR